MVACGTIAAGAGAGEQVVLPARGHGRQGAFGGILVDFQMVVIMMPNLAGHVGTSGELRQARLYPGGQAAGTRR